MNDDERTTKVMKMIHGQMVAVTICPPAVANGALLYDFSWRNLECTGEGYDQHVPGCWRESTKRTDSSE